jgi:hypothetical protein
LRYKISSQKDKADAKYAYCVQYNCDNESFKADLLADFYFLQSLSRRFKPNFSTFEDICLEMNEAGVRCTLVHSIREANVEKSISKYTIHPFFKRLIEENKE